MWPLRLTAMVAALCAAHAPVRAHDDLPERYRESTERIEKAPADALNYLQRAEVYREEGRWAEARADLARAASLAPGLPAVTLMRARLDLDQGDVGAARAALEALLARQPRHGEARALLSDALTAEGKRSEALDQLDQAIEDLERPTPDHYLRLARLLAAAHPPQVKRAERVLERGIDRLGPAPALVAQRVDLDLAGGRFAQALRWHDRLRPFMGTDPAWLARRGALLEAARRRLEALAAYTSALDAIEALPAHRRSTPATMKLEAEMRAKLDHSSLGRVER